MKLALTEGKFRNVNKLHRERNMLYLESYFKYVRFSVRVLSECKVYVRFSVKVKYYYVRCKMAFSNGG